MVFWRRWHRQWLLADPKRLGRWGERRAERLLRSKDLTVLDRNFATTDGEIDIVAADTDGSLVFVEVKTRAGEKFGPVEQIVTGAKEQRMLKAARAFVAKHHIAERSCRFDFIGIVLEGEHPDVRYYKGAFHPNSRHI